MDQDFFFLFKVFTCPSTKLWSNLFWRNCQVFMKKIIIFFSDFCWVFIVGRTRFVALDNICPAIQTDGSRV